MTETKDYSRTIEVAATPEQAYRSVTEGFGKWWTAPDATLARMGDIASFRFPPKDTSWTFRPIRLEPNAVAEHECVGANHQHDGLPDTIRTEWLGTRMRFEIEAMPNGSKLRFTHEGLAPHLDCYEICEAGWDFFFLKSLKAYLDDGKGTPHSV